MIYMKNIKRTANRKTRDLAAEDFYKRHFAAKLRLRKRMARRPYAEKIMDSLNLYKELVKLRNSR